ADDDGLAVGHAAFESAGVVGFAHEAEARRIAPGGIVEDFIVHLRAGALGDFETHADLHALECLDRDYLRCDARIQTSVPGHAASDANRTTEYVALDHAAGGILILFLLIDEIAEALGCLWIGAIDVGLVPGLEKLFPVFRSRLNGCSGISNRAH